MVMLDYVLMYYPIKLFNAKRVSQSTISKIKAEGGICSLTVSAYVEDGQVRQLANEGRQVENVVLTQVKFAEVLKSNQSLHNTQNAQC